MEEIIGRDHEVNRSIAANDESDDLLIDRSSGTVEIDANKPTSEGIEETPKLIESLEPDKSRKNMKFNLRKSLAWDSAFFTSDGVLDADELTTMIEGNDNGVKHCLPGIEEEVYRSMESISTLESDNLSLDCLEAELFQDIRASIQNSNISNSMPKKVDLDYGKQLGARIKDNKTSSIPQPKIISRVKPNINSTSASTKRASLSANNAKKDQDTAKQAHVAQKATQTVKTATKGSKLTGVSGPIRGVSKPLLNSKSSSLGTSAVLKTDPTRPSSSCSNSSGSSSGTDIKVKPLANISRKKVDSKTGKLTTTSVVPQTHSRIIKNKPPPVNSNVSSNISPASSVSEWSSQSSLSNSVINQKPTSRSSINPTDRISSKKGDQSVAVHPSSQRGSVSRPPTVQPTGLRMPSPKIGFFDAGKPGARTPNGGIGVKYEKIRPPKTAAVAANMKPSQHQQTSKPETKPCHVTSGITDHKTESSLNICVKPSENVNDDSNKRPGLENDGSETLSSECLVTTNMKPSQLQISPPETKTCHTTSDVLDHKTESSLSVCVKASENVDDGSNKQAGLESDGYKALYSEQQTSKPETKTCHVTSVVTDHETASSLNVCVQPFENLDDDSNKLAGLESDGYEALSSECFVSTKPSQHHQSEQTSIPNTVTCHVTSDVSDHKTESNLNVCVKPSEKADDDNLDKRAGLKCDGYEALSSEYFVATNMIPSQQQQTSKPETKACHVAFDASDHNTESSLNVCVKPSETVNDDSNEQAGLENDGSETLSSECVVATDVKPSQQQTSAPETKTCHVSYDVTDHKTESNVTDSNTRAGKVLSNECFVATNMKPSQHHQSEQASKPETKTCHVTSDVSDHKTESSLNVCVKLSENVDDDDSNNPAGSGSDGYEVVSIESFVVKDDKMDKLITDDSRTPFADKNSVSDTDGTGMEVTEKRVNFQFVESQQNENSEVV